MFQIRGLAGEEDRENAASYCGQKFGITSADFQPCVNYYVNNNSGDYVPAVAKPPVQATATITVPGGSPGTQISTTAPFPYAAPTPWYKTPIGIIGILAGLFAGYKLLNRPKSS